MSRQLIESIVSNNMLEANDMVEAKLAEIRERKMYEMKRMYAARMDEIFGALTKTDIEKRRKAGYKKASEVLGDPREKERKSPRLNPGAKILKHKVSEETLDEAGLGDAARFVHSMSSTEKNLFKSAKGGNIASALKLRASIKKRRASEKDAEPKDYQRPGMIKRNINTLMGREPGHVDTRTPEQKLMKKGGRVGKVVRGVAGVAGGAVGAVGKELGSIGFSNLE